MTATNRIDANARVRSSPGGVIAGLYPAGNACACVFGPAYPGGGATIAPALTFGHLAGKHAVAEPQRQLSGTEAREASEV